MNGIITPLMTPFDNNGEVDSKSLVKLIEYQIEGGIDAIFLYGTAGEGAMLTEEQRRYVLEIAISTINGQVPLLAGVSDVSEPRVIERIKCLEKHDIKAYVATLPYFSTITPREQASFYKNIAKSTKRNLMLYNIPAFTRSEIDIPVIRDLLEVPNIIGIKESSGNVLRWRDLAALKEQRPEFRLFTGHPALVDIALELGFDGGVLSLVNIMPGLCKSLYCEWEAGRFDNARELQQRMLKIHNMISTMIKGTTYSSIAPIKLILKQLGIFENSVMVSPYEGTSEKNVPFVHEIAELINNSILRPGLQ